ncbi:bola-like protein-domain-containing protein [Scheffersomyces coipomensis]|uniref:bola-like protein-domain-containing protein n=1 Tax=Scheffersomyces coipomensis TaxID=1788519 RepID=UPI00315C7407
MTTAPASIIKSANPGPIEETIVDKLTNTFNPSYLKVANDSHKHSHHAGMRGASNVAESHFRIEIVSEAFAGKNMPSRHRLIYALLDDELKNQGVHALQMKTKTAAEANKDTSV